MTKIEALELELAARKMVEGTGLDWQHVIRYRESEKDNWDYCTPGYGNCWQLHIGGLYELALGIVEGKPVWQGDIVYTCDGRRIVITKDSIVCESRLGYELSWNPPKPKTVLVELPIAMAEYYASLQNQDISVMREACRKALEGMK